MGAFLFLEWGGGVLISRKGGILIVVDFKP